LLNDEGDLQRLQSQIAAEPLLRGAICQPYVAGRSVSVGILIHDSRDLAAPSAVDILPPAEQSLSNDGRFVYLGGAVPARGVDDTTIRRAALAACRAVPGLQGYVGIDLIIPDAAGNSGSASSSPIVVEINPRLSTSYLGYRELACCNLAERIVFPERIRAPIEWKPGVVAFDTAGHLRHTGNSADGSNQSAGDSPSDP
jgi:tyramine---L-glutamate ligase